jgi:hypothetical protein
MNFGTIGLTMAVLFVLGVFWRSLKINIARTGLPSAVDMPVLPRDELASTEGRQVLDLRQSLRAMSYTYAPTLERLGVRLALRLPDRPLPVAIVQTDLHKLFAHLIDLSSGLLQQGVTLQVLARIEGSHAVVDWRDAGAGTPRLPCAFDAAGGAIAPGVLACRQIAGRHGARLYAAPSPLGGDCLTLRFPLRAWPHERTAFHAEEPLRVEA